MQLDIIETHIQVSPEEQICFFCECEYPIRPAIIPPGEEYHLAITNEGQQLDICKTHFATLQPKPIDG